MPNWKKLIVSGSDASLNSLNVTNNVTAQSFTGSFSGSVTAPGSTTQIVYNDNGVLAANSGFVYSGSNVGIGISAPTEKLHIVSSATGNQFGRITATDSDSSAAWVAQNDSGDNVVYRVFSSGVSGTQMGSALGRSASLLANLGGSGVFLLGTFSNTNFVLGTNNTERMRITNGGNVGIGTTSPTSKLDVRGTLTVSGSDANADIKSSTTTSTLNIYGSDTSTNFLGVGILSDNVTRWRAGMVDSRKYQIAYADGGGSFTPTAAMTIVSGSGNVGIGTVNPSAKLHVGGGEIRVDAGQAITLDIANSMYLVGASNQLRLYNGGNPVVNITTGGNVGIGTTSPSKKLEVASSDIKVNDVIIGRGPGTVSGGINHNIAFGVSNYSSSYAVPDRAHIAIGYNAFKNLTAGYYSIAIGGYSLDAALEPDECIAIGLDALGSATYPGYSVAIGNGSLFSDTEGYGNVAVGARAGNYLNSAFGGYGENTLLGNSTAQQLKNARETTAVGAGALFGGTLNLSRANTAIGSSAGASWVSGSYNVWLGYNTNGFISGSNNVIIGSRVSTTAIDGAGVLNNSIILADGAGNVRLFVSGSGNVGIGTTTPGYKLEVVGAVSASTYYGDGSNLTGIGSGSVAAAGSDGQLQYNNSGLFGGASRLYYNDSTNRVGIGTSSPGYDLDVSGSARVQDRLRVGVVNTGNGVIHQSSDATINPLSSTIVWSVPGSAGICAFIEYYVFNSNTGTSQRAGNIVTTWNSAGTPQITHTETTTPDIGTTALVTFTTSITLGGDPQLVATNTSGDTWYMIMNYRYF
jgi:hypothetical protein